MFGVTNYTLLFKDSFLINNMVFIKSILITKLILKAINQTINLTLKYSSSLKLKGKSLQTTGNEYSLAPMQISSLVQN